ncbi:uncharacterized protein LOC133743674 [Rosa rugosa]|uniref:uncharacterized protein LOC133743674 n=1 Tax=Rosa rugosa TaxID=74645 RepID=UPI002B41388A|nr:uncharacterized protein LOC133743674 [Rosa rugosa]
MDYIIHSKAIKFLLSISVFSILFSQSSLISFLVHFSNAFISSPSVRLFSYTFDKNYMFLLCNGLLVFIVKNSGLIGTSPSGSNLINDEDDVKINGETREVGVVKLTETNAQKAEEDQVINVETEQVQEEEKRFLITEEEEECRNGIVTVEDHDEFEEEEEEECRNGIVIVEDHNEFEEEGEEEVGYLSKEELNKKCDEFIRKVREGIKLEVQQSMIMVSCQ